jgi:peptidoglycan/LPS O-acetylase OafA/YrhL
MAPSSDRYHSLDFLRAFVMFLGILLHGMLSFTDLRIPFWPAHDDERSMGCDLFIFIVHDFRMQTFYFLAGFFGGLLLKRYGVWGMISHRFVRIAVPFGLGLILIQPILQALWLLGDLDALRFVGFAVDHSRSRIDLIAEHFASGGFLKAIQPMHLWFLYYLLIFFAAMAALAGLGRAIAFTQVARFADRGLQRLLGLRGKTFVLATITAPLMWTMQLGGMVDNPNNWDLAPNLLGYYFLFFFAGWQLWRHRSSLNSFTRRWPGSLLLAAVLIPIYLQLAIMGVEGRQGKAPLPGDLHFAALYYVSALFTWLVIGGSMGAFQHFFGSARPSVRYLADASYWCYLWHLVPIVALQIALEHAPISGTLKFTTVIGVSLAILLVTYEWCVRYTFVGAILNGRKFRPQPSLAAVET